MKTLLYRFSASLLDAVIILLLSFLFLSLLFSLTGFDYYRTELITETHQNHYALFCFLIASALFLAFLVSDVLVPLLLKNGETIGKKIFSLTLIRIDGRKVGTGTLILRSLTGKYLIETLPVLLLLVYAFFSYSTLCLLTALILSILNISVTLLSKNQRALHDMIAKTVVIERER